MRTLTFQTTNSISPHSVRNNSRFFPYPAKTSAFLFLSCTCQPYLHPSSWRCPNSGVIPTTLSRSLLPRQTSCLSSRKDGACCGISTPDTSMAKLSVVPTLHARLPSLTMPLCPQPLLHALVFLLEIMFISILTRRYNSYYAARPGMTLECQTEERDS